MKRNILPVFIPFAGCSQKCIFCNQPAITGVNSDLSEESIKNQITQYLGYSKDWDQLAFYGGSFSCLSKKNRSTLYNLAKDYGFTSLRFSTRPDCISEKLIEEFVFNNVHAIELGVQSMDDDVLSLNRRSYSKSDVIYSINLLKDRFEMGVQVMPGMFGDDFDKFTDTINSLLIKGVNTVRIYPSCIYKDTELEKFYIEGSYSSLSIKDAVMLTAFAYVKFYNFGIDIIRMGLPLQGSSVSEMVAGPKHEAFGDIVKSYILLLFCQTNIVAEHKISLPRQFAGYKSIVKENFNCFADENISNIDDLWGYIVSQVQESYFEDNLWYLQRPVVEYAKKIECTANNR